MKHISGQSSMSYLKKVYKGSDQEEPIVLKQG